MKLHTQLAYCFGPTIIGLVAAENGADKYCGLYSVAIVVVLHVARRLLVKKAFDMDPEADEMLLARANEEIAEWQSQENCNA